MSIAANFTQRRGYQFPQLRPFASTTVTHSIANPSAPWVIFEVSNFLQSIFVTYINGTGTTLAYWNTAEPGPSFFGASNNDYIVAAAASVWLYMRFVSGTTLDRNSSNDRWINLGAVNSPRVELTRNSANSSLSGVGTSSTIVDVFMQVSPIQPTNLPTSTVPAGATYMGRVTLTATAT